MRVPADIVTGFLGSGKTTLLKHVLEHGLCGDRVAVLVNDVADFDVDGRVISAAGLTAVETVIELENGCICCSVDARFELAVQDVVENLRPDLVLIEASGVADPRLLLHKLEGTMVALDAVITVVDCDGIDGALETSEAARGQVDVADFLVLNKTDLVDQPRIDELSRLLARRNCRALQLRVAHGRVERGILFGTSVRRYRQAAAFPAIGHLESDGIEAVTLSLHGPLRRDAFEAFLAQLPAAVYRAKGIVRFEGEHAPTLFNCVRGRSHLQWLPAGARVGGESQGVFIGPGVRAVRPFLERAYFACSAT